MDFTITEREEPFTLDEVFEFIDDTNISKLDACELKSRIVDMLQTEKNKVIDDFVVKYKLCDNRSIQCHKALNCADCIAEWLEEYKWLKKQKEILDPFNFTLVCVRKEGYEKAIRSFVEQFNILIEGNFDTDITNNLNNIVNDIVKKLLKR